MKYPTIFFIKKNQLPLFRLIQTTKHNFSDKKKLFTKKKSDIREATVESETKSQYKSKTIKTNKYESQQESESKSATKSILSITKQMDLENTFARCAQLRDKRNAIVFLMSSLVLSNIIVGAPFYVVSLHYHQYLPMCDILVAYILSRSFAHIPPGNHMNDKLMEYFLIKFPSLMNCKWSRKLPNPNAQTIEDAIKDTKTMAKRKPKEEEVNDEDYLIQKKHILKLKQFFYQKAIDNGWVYDIADNARFLTMMQIFTGFLYYSGFGTFISSTDFYNPFVMKFIAAYACAATFARATSGLQLRFVVLPRTEKTFKDRES